MERMKTFNYSWLVRWRSFEGKFRDGVHVADTRDMMRRLTKEELLKFDGKPLFLKDVLILFVINYQI